jgi:DNA-binding winged helix-turn-helix (wHTH) protein/predicted ATPase
MLTEYRGVTGVSMADEQGVSFGPYRLTGPVGPLWRHTEEVTIPPKALAVLWELVNRAGAIVTKEELLAAVWTGTVVGDEALTTCMRRLRRALAETADGPHYIQTVHRVGYRFIEKVVSSQQSVVSKEDERQRARSTEHGAKIPALPLAPSTQHPAPPLVGREAELTQLHSLFAKAMTGERQLVFVTGEAGIGKTSLVDTFLGGFGNWELGSGEQKSQKSRRVGNAHQHKNLSEAETVGDAHPTQSLSSTLVLIAQGQCIEHYGAGEAYLPVLEALGRLGRGPQKERLLTVLHQYAPTWLGQLPALLSATELEAVQRRTQGATRERMLREIVDAFDALSTDHPVILVLEDLHWSDPSTVEFLTAIARRRESARLLVLGTYRAADLAATNHPLQTVKQELVARGHTTEVALSLLSPTAVREYISHRVAADATADTLAAVVYRRTDGQPLFMVHLMDYLVHHGGHTTQSPAALTAVEQTLPHGLREMIEAQLGRLTADEHNVLEVGSVGGVEFVVASVAAGLAKTEPEIEEMCDRLARRGQFLEERGVNVWPDGTVSGSYRFRHALYHEVVYQRVSASRQVRLHRQVGLREEAGYGERTPEIAAQLAMHFERGQDKDRAVLYLQTAGENALQRNAYLEALGHFQKGAEFVQTLPQTADRARRELALQFFLSQALAAVKGHASVEVERAYLHARALCERVGTTQQLFFVLLALFRLRHGHCEYQQARDLGAQCLALAQREHDPALFFPAYYALGASELYLGNFAAAENYLTQGVRHHDPQHDATYVALYGSSSLYVSCSSYAATALWFLGYPDQAVRGVEDVLKFATELAAPLTVAGTKSFASFVYQCCRQGAFVQEQAEEGIAVSTQMGFPFWRALCLVWRGWGLAEQGHYKEGIQQIQQGLTAQRATGSSVHRVHFSVLLAEAHGHAGQCDEGLRLLAEAEVEMEKTAERFYEAELWRMKGELTLQQFKVQSSRFKVEESPESEVRSPKSLKPKSQIPEPAPEAEACFLKAIEVARQQQAKSLELRAVMSLVRLRRQHALEQGAKNETARKRESQNARKSQLPPSFPASQRSSFQLTEAHSMLADVYHWFTEGFDTKDLQEARILLEELGH